MFRIFVLISRYIFIGCMLLFLWETLKYCFGRDKEENSEHFVLMQRIIITVICVLGFTILQIKEFSEVGIKSAYICVSMVIFIAVFSILTDKIYKKSASVICNCVLMLMTTGILTLTRLNNALAMRQIIWFWAGLAVISLLPVALKGFPPPYKLKYLFIAAAIVLTAFTFFTGEEIYGSKNWISIGGIGFQPSEISKLLLILYLSSAYKKRAYFKDVIITGVFSAVIVLLLVMEKDLGGALIFFMTYMVMMYAASANGLFFLAGLGAASGAACVAYKIFNHVRVRVSAWIDPWKDIDRGGYQIAQSLFAIGAGGFIGTGLTLGMPLSIPFVEKDVIFSAVCEEFGCIYGIGIILIFLTVFALALYAALNSKSRFVSMILVGITANMSFQTFVIIGGNLKLIPLTGVTLPFISYGGSSLIISMAMVSLICAGCMHAAKEAEKECSK